MKKDPAKRNGESFGETIPSMHTWTAGEQQKEKTRHLEKVTDINKRDQHKM